MPHGQFEFDSDKSPTFSLEELKRMKLRALAEPGAVEQFHDLAARVTAITGNSGYKVDATLLLGLMITELALHIMAERERSQRN